MDRKKLKSMLGEESFSMIEKWEIENGSQIYPDQPERSKREEENNECNFCGPKTKCQRTPICTNYP